MRSRSTPSTGISPPTSTTAGPSSPARSAVAPTVSRCFPRASKQPESDVALRRPYRESLVERHPLGLEERWFAGVHADVGGTFMPDHRLATIALKWITDGIVGEMAVDEDAYQEQCAVLDDFADAPIHNNGKLW